MIVVHMTGGFILGGWHILVQFHKAIYLVWFALYHFEDAMAFSPFIFIVTGKRESWWSPIKVKAMLNFCLIYT